ncbi:MAG: antibiotic biosynthesis monooxygenase [Solirubrobacterales bacterium]|nr:antibiotic biosynthesis monooxygenase [Solirubrobacterales bacterium]
MDEIVVVAILTVKEGMSDRALEVFRPVIEATHQEPGCVSYALHRDNSDPDRLVLVEKWLSQDDLDAHFQQPHMAEMGSLAGELLAEPPLIVFSSAIPVGEPDKGLI